MNRLQKTLVLAAVFATASSAFALNCTATHRRVISQNNVQETVVPLVKSSQVANMEKYEVDLKEGVYMSATYTQGSDEVMLTIVKAPNYTDGVITRAALNNGRASLAQTEIEKQTGNLLVYRLQCSL